MSLLGSNRTEEFLASALVVWVQSYVDVTIKSNTDLANGVLLKNVLTVIDPVAFGSLHVQTNSNNTITSNAQNLAEILHGIKKFYQEKLQQLIVMKMPDILMVAKEPDSEMGFAEMKSIILLILGCAIQCDKKEEFIEHIKDLEIDVQRNLVMCIQEITENDENLIPYRVDDVSEMTPEELISLAEGLYCQVLRALEQRDEYLETIFDLALFSDQNEDDNSGENSPGFRKRVSPRSSFRSQNILQTNRQIVNNLQSELDDRIAQTAELKTEIGEMHRQLENFRFENKRLVNEAAWATSYRDELDILKTQLDSANKIRMENTKLKEKVRELEYYKTSYEELREQSDILFESKLLLEERVAGTNSKINRYSELEEKSNNLQNEIHLLIDEREDDRLRIRELVDQVAKLSMDKMESISACSTMNAELDGLRMQKQDDGSNVPLFVEYNQSTSADVLRLEQENMYLSSVIDNMRSDTPTEKIEQLEFTNQQLSGNIFEYKNMITMLTKSLFMEKGVNQELGEIIEGQNNKLSKMSRSLSVDVEAVTKKLAKQGLELDVDLLKEALKLENTPNWLKGREISNGNEARNTKEFQGKLHDKIKKINMLEVKVQQAKNITQKVEILLDQKKHELEDAERSLDMKVLENSSLQRDVILHKDKVKALEERVSHLLTSANEDTKKINLSLEAKLKRIGDLESSLYELQDTKKECEQIEEELSATRTKLGACVEKSNASVQRMRDLELELEKSRSNCSSLEHQIKLKDERSNILETSLDELSASTSSQHSDRISLLVSSLHTHSSSITELEQKIDDLIVANEKLKNINRTKTDVIEDLQNNLDDLQKQAADCSGYENKVKSLANKVAEKEESCSSLELKIDELKGFLNKSKRGIQQKDEKIVVLEKKLEDFDDVKQQKDRLALILDERSRKSIDLETKLDTLQNENNKLDRIVKQQEEQYKIATQSLCTLEASIADQSSLSKLIKLKEVKIEGLLKLVNKKDDGLVELENKYSESEGKVKRLKNSLKLKEEKLSAMEQSIEKLAETETRNAKLMTTIQLKDKQIHGLEDRLDELHELSRVNSRMKESCNQKALKIAGLEQRIDDLEDVVQMNERLNNQVKLKEDKIRSLQERLQELDSKLHKVEQDRDLIKRNLENEISRLEDLVSELSDFKVKRQMSLMRRDKKITNLELRLNEFESETKKSEIEELHQVAQHVDQDSENRDKKIADLETRLKEFQNICKENASLKDSLTKKESELLKLRSVFEEHNSRAELLNKAKEKIIAELQERMKETLGLNSRLNQSVIASEDNINELERELAQKDEHIGTLSSEVQSKDRLLERSNEKCGELSKQTTSLLEENEEIHNECKRLNAERDGISQVLAEKDSVISTLQRRDLCEVQTTKNEVEENAKLAKEAEQMINNLQKSHRDLQSELHKCKLQVQEKEGTVADLQQRIEEYQMTGNDKLQSVIKEKTDQISTLRLNIDEYQVLLAQLETKVEEISSQLAHSNTVLIQKDERLKGLKAQLEGHVSKSHQLTNELKLKEETLMSVTKSLEEMTRRNKDLEEDISSLENDLQNLKSSGSLKNITNITEKIKLTKRARVELHIQRGPRMNTDSRKIEIKMSPEKTEEAVAEKVEEIEKLRKEIDCLEKQQHHLQDQMTSLSLENAVFLSENESLKSECELLKLDFESCKRELSKAHKHCQEVDVSAVKVTQRCEGLTQLNSALEKENSTLLQQVNKLISQNQVMLASTMQSRDQQLDDERAFSDHIYALEREREKLSEKVGAAERALQDSGNKKKSVLWRGTRKILKKTGLAKKNSNPGSPNVPSSEESSPYGIRKHTSADTAVMSPIRSLLTRSRQDIPEVLTRQPSGNSFTGSSESEGNNSRYLANKPRPKSEFFSKPLDYDVYEMPRPQSMESVHANERTNQVDGPIETNTVSHAATSKDFTSNSCRSAQVEERARSPSRVDSMNSSSDGNKTPIQKVRVKEMKTAEVMRTPKENNLVIECLDYMARQSLEQSPGQTRRFTRPIVQSSSEPTSSIRSNLSSPLVFNKTGDFVEADDVQPIPFQRSVMNRRSGKLSDEINDTSFFYQQNNNNVDDDAISNSTYSLGNREQRASIRRVEMEHMEPRPMRGVERKPVARSKSNAGDDKKRVDTKKRKTWYEYGDV